MDWANLFPTTSGYDYPQIGYMYPEIGAAPQQAMLANALTRRLSPQPVPPAVKANPGLEQAYNAEIAKRMADTAPIVREASSLTKKTLIVGFRSANLGASVSADLTERPRYVIKPRFIVCPAAVATAEFVINDVVVQGRSQLPSGTSLDTGTLLPAAVPTPLDFDTVPVNGEFTMRVTNGAGGAAVFRASVYCDAILPG